MIVLLIFDAVLNYSNFFHFSPTFLTRAVSIRQMQGYMPISDGLVRKYEAVGLTDGFYASSEYTYVADENGDIVIFADKCGIKNILAPTTML